MDLADFNSDHRRDVVSYFNKASGILFYDANPIQLSTSCNRNLHNVQRRLAKNEKKGGLRDKLSPCTRVHSWTGSPKAFAFAIQKQADVNVAIMRIQLG